MAGYYGTPEQQRLQARAEENAGWVATTPGACNSGRFIGCDDIDLFSWSRIEEIIGRDGAIGFRLLQKERVPELTEWMTSRGYRIDFWDPFIGEREEVLCATSQLLSKPLPSGLSIGPKPQEPSGPYIQAIQRLMSDNGVAPYSGALLAGRLEPAITATILDADGDVVACAFGHKPHNSYSSYHNYGYGGGVVVNSSFRGMGLGRYVNALIASRVLEDLDASHFYGFVSANNEPSRRMVSSCAMKVRLDFVGALAVAGDRKFTR
ncbi:GNAT family N-acetyltransferase [Parvibaculum sp.]|uniref:GNAT family N-acetyltransferase n=1 Tax=Parvibaculum sp. TaxID=2024848 RepID=UPI003BADA572